MTEIFLFQFETKAAGFGSQESLLLHSLQSGVEHKRSSRSSDLSLGDVDIDMSSEDDGVLGGGLGGFLQVTVNKRQ